MTANAATDREDQGGVMLARVTTPAHPADKGSADIQLSWWAIALPSAAFAILLLLILNPADAHAASSEPLVTQVLQSLKHLLLPQSP
jgi:hypothetical protein